MKNFVQSGSMISAIAPYALMSGQGAKVGSLFGVAAIDAAAGASVELAREGVFDIAAAPTDVGNPGAKVYWDDTARRATTTASGNTLIGALTGAKIAADVTARVLLDGALR
jgi:predicted RecA/RadA family phage recombinase